MERHDLDNLLLWKRRQFLRLSDIADLTRQLAQALDRRDQVSVQMILSMRQEPLQQAEEMEKNIQSYFLTMQEDDAIRCQAIMTGAAPPESPEEIALCGQVARNRQLLEDITALDRTLSVRLGGKQSFYHLLRHT